MLAKQIALIFLFLFSTATVARAEFSLGEWDPVLYQEKLSQFKGRRIRAVEFSSTKNVPEVLQQKFRSLKGQPLQMDSVRQIVHWFHESLGDSRVEVLLREEGSELVLIVKFQQRPKIADVKFIGAEYFPASTLQAMIELKAKSELDPVALDNSVSKILSLYQSQGFFSATVKPEYGTNQILSFNIHEGEATRVASVTVSPITSVENKILKRRLESDLIDYFGVSAGERVEKEKLNNGLLNVKTWLRDHDFLIAKDPIIESELDASGRMHIHININYGSRIRFGFRGNNLFSYRELIAHVAEVKEVTSGTDYLEAVRRKIIDLYKEAGFVNVSINTLVREDAEKGIKHVSLIVDEAGKVRISRIAIEGIYSLPQEEAKDLLLSFSNRLNQRGYFQESGLTHAAELLADHLRSHGYLSAKLEFTKFDFNEDRTQVVVTLLYNEGVQTRIQNAKINGAKSISEAEILETLGLRMGEPFDIFSFEKGLALLKDKYQDLGHLAVRILNEGSDSVVQYSADQTLASVRVDIEEGPVMKVGEIIVRGNSQTHTKVILRELPFIENDILTRPLLREAEDNLRKLNLFGSVIVRPIEHPGEEAIRDILILVEETIPGSIEITPGFRNDLGLKLGLGAAYQNLGGWNRGISGNITINRRLEDFHFLEYSALFSFREPYFANWPVTLVTSLDFLKRQFVSFDANISKITASFRRDLSRHITGILEYSYERNDIRNVKPPYSKEFDEKISFIGAVTPGFILDSRNDKFNPASGVLSSNRLEIASNFWGSEQDIGYYRGISTNSTYFQLFDGVVLALAANVGYERSNIADKPIPTFKLFRLGGIGSLRGYSIDAIEVETDKLIKGSLSMFNYRSELRLPISGSFGTALFWDAGNLSIDHIVPFKVRNTVGAGLRYNTPVGPVALDFGYKLETDTTVGDTTVDDPARYRISFAIGSF